MNDVLIQQYGIFFIGAGLSIVLFLLLFLVLRRNAQKRKGLRPNAQAAAMAAAALEKEAEATPQIDMGQGSENQHDTARAQGDMASEDNGSGFKLMKRQRKKSTDKNTDAPRSDAASQDDLARLVDIEQEMLAIREMFRQGEISRSVYVAETKALYETARLVKP